jgi:glucokinase
MSHHATSPSPGWLLGFDVGGTKTAVVAGTANGRVLRRISRPSDAAAGFRPMWDAMVSAADELIGDLGPPQAIGVSIGGPMDAERGIIHSPPNLPGWDDIPLRDLLADRFGVPTWVEHDARTGALAEWMFGAARGTRDMVYLTFGTGLGAGLILGGRLHSGWTGVAGEVGHWRMARRGPVAFGKSGSFEAMSSGAGLPRLARYLFPKETWPPGLTAQSLIGMARAGDPRALRVISVSAGWLGQGIAQLVDLLNPEVVVLGSLAVRAGDLFLPTARDVMARESLPRNRACRIVASTLGEHAGDVAALCAAIYHGGFGASGDGGAPRDPAA